MTTPAAALHNALHKMEREEFVHFAAVMALQGSMANSTARATTASLVREADSLWTELQDWKQTNNEK